MQSKLTPAKKREFQEIYPKSQKFSKTDLAKYMMVWEEKPHIVSQGAQKNFKAFGELIVPRWNKNDKEFNDLYYKHLVAKIIIFKTCDKIIFKQVWYGGYKANIVAYTLSTISYLLSQEKLSIDFTNIWNIQDISTSFKIEIKNISRYINDYLTSPPKEFRNISEWAKKEICWKKLKDKINKDNLLLSDDFKKELIKKEDIDYEHKEAKKIQKIDNELELLKKLFHIPIDKWDYLIDWGIKNHLLVPSETKLIEKIKNINFTSKIPTAREQKKIVGIIRRLEDEGMKTIL